MFFLALFGILMQYSASNYIALRDTGDSFFYVKKQSVALFVGIVAMVCCRYISLEKLKKYTMPFLIFSIILLALLFIPGVGVEKYGATRWLNLGFFTFQPSELAKFALMFFIAKQLSIKSSNSISGMWSIMLATAIICCLIMLEPNMSITMCVGLSVLLMLFVGGCTFKHYAVMSIPLLIGTCGLIVLEPYRIKRIMAFLDPWSSPLGEGYQLIQSFYALAGGGLFGVGLFQSRQKYLFLPFAESDFIFSIIGEEFGLAGCTIIIFFFGIIIYQGIKIGLQANTRYESYLACGIICIIGVQTLLNIAVVSGAIPPTGLPLPFVSAGGSSLVVFMSSIGILQKISSNSRKEAFGHKLY